MALLLDKKSFMSVLSNQVMHMYFGVHKNSHMWTRLVVYLRSKEAGKAARTQDQVTQEREDSCDQTNKGAYKPNVARCLRKNPAMANSLQSIKGHRKPVAWRFVSSK